MKARSYLQRFDNVELAVRQRGVGIPLVWGHGLMGSVKVEDQAGLLDWEEVEGHAEVVRYDARGHGNSDGSYDPQDYRWGCMAQDMLAETLPSAYSLVISHPSDISGWTPALCEFLDKLAAPKKRRPAPKKHRRAAVC